MCKYLWLPFSLLIYLIPLFTDGKYYSYSQHSFLISIMIFGDFFLLHSHLCTHFVNPVSINLNVQDSFCKIISPIVSLSSLAIQKSGKISSFKFSSFLVYLRNTTWKKLHTVQLACIWFNFFPYFPYSLFLLVAGIIGHSSFFLREESPSTNDSLKRAAEIYQQSTCGTSVKQAIEKIFENLSDGSPVNLSEGGVQTAFNNLLCMDFTIQFLFVDD